MRSSLVMAIAILIFAQASYAKISIPKGHSSVSGTYTAVDGGFSLYGLSSGIGLSDHIDFGASIMFGEFNGISEFDLGTYLSAAYSVGPLSAKGQYELIYSTLTGFGRKSSETFHVPSITTYLDTRSVITPFWSRFWVLVDGDSFSASELGLIVEVKDNFDLQLKTNTNGNVVQVAATFYINSQP